MPSDLHGWHRQVSGTQAPSELGSRSHPLTPHPEGKHPDQASLSQAAACTHCSPAPAVCGFHPKEDDVLRLRPLSPCLVSLLCAGGPAPSAPFHVSAWVIPAVPHGTRKTELAARHAGSPSRHASQPVARLQVV